MAHRVTYRVSVGSATFLVDVERAGADYRCRVREVSGAALAGTGCSGDACADDFIVDARVDSFSRVFFYDAQSMWLCAVEKGPLPGETRVVSARHPGSGPWPVRIEDGRVGSVPIPRAKDVVRAAVPVTAPMPGRLVRLLVALGDTVVQGQAIAVIEAMKMENELFAPRAGTITELRAREGAPVEPGIPLLVIG